MINSGLLKWLNAAAFLIMIAVNAMANLLPLGGNTTGMISEQYRNLFTPAPVTFAVWGVIYALLAGFIVWQFAGSRVVTERVVGGIGLMFLLSCMANVLWILLWHNNLIPFSMIAMLALLASLIFIMSVVGSETGIGRWAFSTYLGWITVAAMANFVVMTIDFGWKAFAEPNQAATVVLIVLAALVVGLVGVWLKDWIYVAVGFWGITGIMIRQINDFGAGYRSVAVAAFLSAVVLLTTMVMIITDGLSSRSRQKRITMSSYVERYLPDQSGPGVK